MLIVKISMLVVSILLTGLKTRSPRRRKNSLTDLILIIALVRKMNVERAIVSAFIKVRAVILQNANV
jgi:hypothetical protein